MQTLKIYIRQSRCTLLDFYYALTIIALSLIAFQSIASASDTVKTSPININSPTNEQAVRLHIKTTGSLEPAIVYTWFSGHLWGIVPGSPARKLVSFEGIAKNVWRHDGNEITKQSYDIGYFGDVETGAVIDSYINPYTGKVVAPYHYAYGGGITRYSKTGIVSDGKVKSIDHQWTVSGEQAWFEESNSASVVNPFDPKQWPLASAGKEIHFGSSTTNAVALSDLLDNNKSNIPYTLFWTAVNSWEPWLHMADAPGYVMWRATGRKLGDLSEAPDSIINYVNKIQPNYFEADQPWKGIRSTWADYRRDRKPALQQTK